MRVFRPTVWLVLQDVALDAELRDGRLVASTSARLVATHLRIDPGTAATALRTLRDRGVVELSQAAGPNGRFGLATYTLHLPDGVDVSFEALGRPELADTAFRSTRVGGTTVLIGQPPMGVKACFDVYDATQFEHSILGSNLGGAVPARLRAVPTLLAQVAASFASNLAPAGVGGMALNVRYLRKSGVDAPVAASSVVSMPASVGARREKIAS